MAATTSPTFAGEELTELLPLIEASDSVELKLTVPEDQHRSTVAALGIDPLDAQIRQVVFFDTPELTLNQHGVVVRARRIQRKPGDSVVKVRPLVPEQLPPAVRRSRGVEVEVDAMPGGFVCSGSMKAQRDDVDLKDVLGGRRPLRTLFTKQQRAFFAAHAPDGVQLDDLAVLGPINVLKVKFTPEAPGRRLV